MSPQGPKEPLARNPSLWLIVPTLALLLGQAAAASAGNPPWPYLLIFLPPMAVLFWRGQRGWALLLLFALSAFSLGFARHRWLLDPRFPPGHIRSVMSEGSPLHLEGILDQEPEQSLLRSRWAVRAQRIWHPTGAEEIEGKILLAVRHANREWRYGDRVRLRVRPRIPPRNGNPGGFDYAAYLARRGIYATGFLENDEGVELLQRGSATPWGLIEYLRREIRRFMEQGFSQDSGALMKALVVGDARGVSREMRTDFTRAGLSHLLSISGLHVGMLGLVVFLLARFFGGFSVTVLLRLNLIKLATLFSFLAVLFYAALAGASVPTVRSAIMIGVYELAVLLDREEEVFASLALAALLVGLVWPGVVMDISFQLSFLAVLFIIWGLRKIQQGWPGRPGEELPQDRGWLRRRLRPVIFYIAVPVLATLGTGPMIAYHFGRLSLAGFLSNLAVVPLVGFVVVPLGLLVGFLSLIAPVLALPLVWLLEPLLTLVQATVSFFSRLPMASIALPMPNLFEAAILYCLLLSFFAVRRRLHLVLVLGVVSAALIADGIYEGRGRKELSVTYLSVGQGDAAVVEFPGSKVLVIDAGGSPTGEFDTGEGIVAPFLRSRKILKVDYLLLSHPRVDHYGGMRAIVEEFAPSEFWSGTAKGGALRYEELERTLERSRIKRVILSSRAPCRWIGRAELCVLYPPEEKGGEASIVASLRFGEARFLFAGDIEKRDEKALLRERPALSSAVLKVPRHGSATASSEEFIAAVRPRLAIISGGRRNPFGLPRQEVLLRYAAAGAEVLRTDRDGAITVETDGKSIRYQTYLSKKQGLISLTDKAP